jgi:hypothetical protein
VEVHDSTANFAFYFRRFPQLRGRWPVKRCTGDPLPSN